MQIERIPFSDDDEVTLFWYQPGDVFPTTHVFGRWEGGVDCGPCAGISLLFLNNSINDFNMVFSSLKYGATDASEGEDKVLYADRHIDAFASKLLEIQKRNGGRSMRGVSGDEVRVLLGELNDHVFWATPGMEITDAGLEGHGTMVDYLADEENQKLLLDILWLYADDPNWQDIHGPAPAVVRSRIRGKTALVLPGDEDLVALAINLYNKGAYEECLAENGE